MENNNRLNELFNKAKNEAPKASFEDIKGQFEQSLITASGSATTSLLTIKNLIMIATVTTLSVGAIMLIDSFTQQVPNPKEFKEETKTEIELVEEHHEKIVFEYVERVNKLTPTLQKEEKIGLNLALKTAEIKLNTPIKSKSSEFNRVNAINNVEDSAYRFPTLTLEEIKTNNKQKDKMIKQLKKFDKDVYAFIPAGTFSVDGKEVSLNAFYIQTTEVTNLEYRTFLFDLLIQGRKDEFLKAKPDQSSWLKAGKWLRGMQTHYFSHPAYNYYPVVNITRKGAELYCIWLTTEVNNINKKKNKKLMNDVRLPSNYEWIYSAKGENDKYPYPWGGPKAQNAKGCYLANFKPGIDTCETCLDSWNKLKDVNEEDSLYGYKQTLDDVKMPKNHKNPYSADGGYYTVKVNSYHPNSYGLFCLSGNVAEMIYYKEENNIPGTKGGSWASPSVEIQINGPDPYKGKTEALPYIGFRPVVTYR